LFRGPLPSPFAAVDRTCPLVGNHSTGADGRKAKFVIASDPKTGRPPFIVEGLPQFVETRGGEYFFVPSMTALRMIGMGTIHPTPFREIFRKLPASGNLSPEIGD
jgi:hypothetical protein